MAHVNSSLSVHFLLGGFIVYGWWGRHGLEKALRSGGRSGARFFPSFGGELQILLLSESHRPDVGKRFTGEELFSKKGLSYIASVIGKPLYMDSITATRERLEYARVCVEISARSQILNFIDVVMCDESIVRIRVSVTWLLNSYTNCSRFGHSEKFCPQTRRVEQVWRVKTPMHEVSPGKNDEALKSLETVNIAGGTVSVGASLSVASDLGGLSSGKEHYDVVCDIMGNQTVVVDSNIDASKSLFKASVPGESSLGKVQNGSAYAAVAHLLSASLDGSSKKQNDVVLGVSKVVQEMKLKKKEQVDKFKTNEERETRVKVTNAGDILSRKFGDWRVCCNYDHAENGWIWLRDMDSFVRNNAWLIGGDFNVILNMEESSNAVNSGTISDMSDFQRCVEELGILDHRFMGPLFTWSNKQQDTYLAYKLDRIRGSPQLVAIQLRFVIEVKRLKICLKELNRSHFHDISGQVQKKRDDLLRIQLSNLNAVVAYRFIEDELKVERELQALELAEMLFYKQKANADWINEGDQGTNFFHSMVTRKKMSNTIRALYDQDGVKLDSFEYMSNEVIHFFRRQLGLLILMLNAAASTSSRTSSATPCLVSAWPIVEKDFVTNIRYFFENSFMLPSFNENTVILVPKVPNLSMGISIVDKTLLAQELVRGYPRKNISPRCTLKINLQKAFNSLDWEFVRIFLRALGLPEKFVGWIWAFITSLIYFIVLNGSLVGYCKGACGVRHVDPLSPYLFVMAMNVLSSLLNVVASKDVFKFHPKCKKIGLTHLCFENDMLIFCEGSIDSVIGVQNVLDFFYSMSGLKLNASKCEIFSVGVSTQQCVAIQEFTGFKLGNY
ncbi:uncharacterized protein LOC120214236 [Hibiscus syriacus]|uniref:uncharacterized protein LOC120214236 n=1 Tax=Hibiscus syriacus TaxID=106335 RepID=UPI0019224CE5|nr:uncharacterized protein LOC120214236 [Hibiscus syriacus]